MSSKREQQFETFEAAEGKESGENKGQTYIHQAIPGFIQDSKMYDVWAICVTAS